MTYPASQYLRSAQKLAHLVSKGIISPVEYANNLLSMAASYDVDEETACQVAASVPLEGRSELDREISVVLSPGYQVSPLAYGGPGPSEAERERIRNEYTQRIRACALHLSRQLSGLPMDSGLS